MAKYCRQRRTSSRVSLVSSSLFVLFVVLRWWWWRIIIVVNTALVLIMLCLRCTLSCGDVSSAMCIYVCVRWGVVGSEVATHMWSQRTVHWGEWLCIYHMQRVTKYKSCMLHLTVTNWAKGLGRARILYVFAADYIRSSSDRQYNTIYNACCKIQHRETG